jgi:hypothetical protein
MSMPIVEYTPKLFWDVSAMAAQIPGPLNLAHRPFVDYYYATGEWSKLYLCYSDEGKIIGTLGRELAPFEYDSQGLTLRIASNWYSLRGVGLQLSRYSALSNPDSTGLLFTGSESSLAVLRQLNWIFVPGIRGYSLNRPYRIYPGESRWRSAAKSVLRGVTRRRVASFAARIPSWVFAEIRVLEESSYGHDLLPARSPFLFRFAPSAEYLSWRYNLSLPFIRYRLFRVSAGGATVGYVILSDSPERIVVAQCDGEDAAALAYGVLLSILEVGREDQEPRSVYLACCHSEMKKIFQQFGFREDGGDLPFAFRNPPPHVDLSLGTSRWLVNFDWGDNGMRQPFRDDGVRPVEGQVSDQIVQVL